MQQPGASPFIHMWLYRVEWTQVKMSVETAQPAYQIIAKIFITDLVKSKNDKRKAYMWVRRWVSYRNTLSASGIVNFVSHF